MALGVAVGVVIALEAIDSDRDDAERAAVALRPRPFACQTGIAGSPVGEAGERIGTAHLFENTARFFEITAALRARIDEVLVIGRPPLRAPHTAREPVADHQQRRRPRERADRQQTPPLTNRTREADRRPKTN